MKTTVGPLPAAVYWRRRAVVLGVLFIVMIMFWSACSSSPAKRRSSANDTALAGSAQPETPTPTPALSTGAQIPIIGTAPPTTEPASTPPSATGSPGVPTCADTDLLLSAAPETATAQAGVYIKFTLNVKNVSGRPCARDLGPDHQELYLQTGTEKMWSSDVCNPAHGSERVLMAPDIVHSYNNTWNGLASDAGCAPNRAAPKPGKYQLIARLDTKLSAPVTVQLT